MKDTEKTHAVYAAPPRFFHFSLASILVNGYNTCRIAKSFGVGIMTAILLSCFQEWGKELNDGGTKDKERFRAKTGERLIWLDAFVDVRCRTVNSLW